MKAILKFSIAGRLVTGFAVALLLAMPAVRAQDQQDQQRQDQPQVQDQPPMSDQNQTDPNATNPNATSPNGTNLPAVDDNITDDESHNPPSRVARISFTNGSVSLQPGGNGDWGVAAKNRPVTIGDKLWVDKDSRAELQAGQIAIHLGGMTALSFLNLDQNVTQIRLPEGRINFRVREIRQGENYEVDTPNLAFTVKEAGAFRIDVNENGDFTSVTAIRGAGEIASAGQVYPVKAGERLDVTGTDGNVKVSTGAAPGPDTLDQWAQQRDLGEDNSPSAKYVNRDTVGYSDLDDYGTWKQDETYGNVWVPNNEPADWAPYSDGNWSYVAPWGWTWVGYEPWGFAPYHYGRWNYFGSYWGWCPGPIYSYPYYGPAYVGWLGGFGLGFGFGFGWGGGFGWFPLGWGEPFHPWYRCGWGYYRNVNIHNTYFHNFNGRPGAYHNWNYVYAHNTHAVTTASHNAFVNGERINRGAQHLNATSLRNAQVTSGIHATPTRASSLGAGNMHGHVATPSANVANRSVMARSAPAASVSHSAYRPMNTSGFSANRGNTAVAHSMGSNALPARGMSTTRQSELSASRPPYATQPGNRAATSTYNAGRPGANSTRSWNAQGNTTDSGRAPQGVGNTNRPSYTVSGARNNSTNRPPWAGSGNTGTYQRNSGTTNRPPTGYSGNRSYNSGAYNGNRSYTPPSYNGNRGYSAPRSYSAPYSAPRSYNAPSPRNYSAPRSYSSAPRSYSAPHSYSGGGGGYHGGGSSGGGGYHGGGGGGGGSHGGGGGHSGGGGHH